MIQIIVFSSSGFLEFPMNILKHVLAGRKIPKRRDHDDKLFRTGMLLNCFGARERQG
jgi:hypothetical protein